MKNATDGATPFGQRRGNPGNAAAGTQMRLATQNGVSRGGALRAVGAFAAVIERTPMGFATILQGLVEDQAFWAREGRTDRPVDIQLELPPKMGPGPGVGPHFRIATLRLSPVRPGDLVEVVLELTVREGFHIQPAAPSEPGAMATVAKVRGDVVASQEWKYPEAAVVDGTKGYAGTLKLVGRLLIAAEAKVGVHAIRASVQGHDACSDTTCYPMEPTATVEAELVVEG